MVRNHDARHWSEEMMLPRLPGEKRLMLPRRNLLHPCFLKHLFVDCPHLPNLHTHRTEVLVTFIRTYRNDGGGGGGGGGDDHDSLDEFGHGS
jgi:hypothetical protein